MVTDWVTDMIKCRDAIASKNKYTQIKAREDICSWQWSIKDVSQSVFILMPFLSRNTIRVHTQMIHYVTPWERWCRGSPGMAPSADLHPPRYHKGPAAGGRGTAAPWRWSRRWRAQCPCAQSSPALWLVNEAMSWPLIGQIVSPGAAPCRHCLQWGLPVDGPESDRLGMFSQTQI